MRRQFLVLQILLACILVTTWTPASGGPQDESAFHLMSIMEVFPGTVLQPNAQYVMLRAYAAGQSFVSGHKLYFFNAAGVKVDSANMPGNVASGANQMSILFATPTAQVLFAIAPDFPMPAAMNPAGGKVCFDASNIDCFAWGNYTGSPVGIGTPYRKDFGLSLGESAIRRMDVTGGATVLDAGDDTNNNDNDFNPGTPAGRNNAGGNVVLPPSTCGNNTLEGLEQCDDGNTDPNDGCNSACDDEFCGDGVVQPGESCDDGNLTSGDGCDLLCQSEPECGNGIVEAGEACDDSNLVAGDGCDPLCQLEPVCGNGIVEAGNLRRLEPCGRGRVRSLLPDRAGVRQRHHRARRGLRRQQHHVRGRLRFAVSVGRFLPRGPHGGFEPERDPHLRRHHCAGELRLQGRSSPPAVPGRRRRELFRHHHLIRHHLPGQSRLQGGSRPVRRVYHRSVHVDLPVRLKKGGAAGISEENFLRPGIGLRYWVRQLTRPLSLQEPTT